MTVAVGEVGLLGELRSVPGLERRLREAARLGYVRAVVPKPSRGGRLPDVPGLEIVPVATLREALAAALSTMPEGAAGDARLGGQRARSAAFDRGPTVRSRSDIP
jgi:DNA repair protein RadA/Sms